MEVPGALFLACPECRKETLHEVLKGRASERGHSVSLSALVKCPSCGGVRKVNVRERGELPVRAILSDRGRSGRCTVALDWASRVAVGDRLAVDGLPCVVTAVEAGQARRAEAPVPRITTLWLKRYDRVALRISVNTGRRTVARELLVPPDREISVGDVLDLDGMRVLVHSISSGGRRLRRGSASASDIGRVYGREVE